MTFIKVFLAIIIIYYVLKIVLNYFLKRFISKHSTGGQRPDFETKKKKEGTINVEFTNSKKENKTKDKGEYIEFEEIK